MESITIKVDEAMAKEIEKAMKPLYSTKTEFIREAIREKITKAEKEELLRKVMALKGSVKTKTSMAEIRKIKEEAWKEYAKERGLE